LRGQKQQVGFFEKAGIWLGLWTGPKGVEVERPSRRKVLAVALGVLVLLGVIAALVIPPLESGKRSGAERERAERAALLRRERAQLAADQRLHLAVGHRPAGPDSPAVRRQARPQLESVITRDARARVKAGKLDGPIRSTSCEPSTRQEETNLRAHTGLYKCLVTTGKIAPTQRTYSATVGYPFVATVDYRRFGFAWCKTNPRPGEKAGHALARVLLDRRCAGRLRAVL
jgi:type II secretory pathway pseudopilin PulG